VFDGFRKALAEVVNRIRPPMEAGINKLATTKAARKTLNHVVAKTLFGNCQFYGEGTARHTSSGMNCEDSCNWGCWVFSGAFNTRPLVPLVRTARWFRATMSSTNFSD
jgi:hypothetical protein